MSNRAVLSLLIILGVATSAVSFLINLVTQSDIGSWLGGWLLNFSTEMFGAAATFGLIQLLLGREQEQTVRNQQQFRYLTKLQHANSRQEKQMLIDEMRALDLLKGASLGTDLQGLSFFEADMTGCIFTNPTSGWAIFANLRNARLHRANLTNAYIGAANLTGANLDEANLSGAEMYDSFGQGAVLEGASMVAVKCDINTILPDGTRWTSSTDWTRFTSPKPPSPLDTDIVTN